MSTYLFKYTFFSTSCQVDDDDDGIAPETMWAAIELASQRQSLFSEDRSGASALCRGKKKKKDEAR